MARAGRNHLEDLRGAGRLAIEATRAVTDLVEAVHLQIAGGPALLGRPLDGPLSALLGLTYGSVRGVTSLVGVGIDQALAPLVPLLADRQAGPELEALLAALNGVIGDYLEATSNPLAIPMALRHAGRALDLSPEALRTALPSLTGRLLVLVHGSSCNDLQWTRRGHDHGAALARDLGFTPLYLHYNTGRHVSENGRDLAAQLDALVAAWPAPVEELVLLGHSMGGLVARSACAQAGERTAAWRLRAMAFLGAPHLGAPLERAGNLVDRVLGRSDYSAPFARLGKIRSAGVTDLRHGSLLDEDWRGRDRFARGAPLPVTVPLPAGVACFAVAASRSAPGAKRPLGDGLVPVASALGRHPDAARRLAFTDEDTRIVYGAGHLDLLDRAEAYEALRAWLA